MKEFLVILLIAMVLFIVFQIGKAMDYVGIIRGEDTTRKSTNKVNAYLLISFLVLGLFGAWYCNKVLYHKTLFPQGSASVEGEQIDTMLLITITITGIVFVITQVLLFWFAFKYREKEGQEALYYPHNTKLEVIWTSIPAITLTILVVFGLITWFKITGDAPAGSQVIEITGHQFGWDMRYPGKDSVLGKTNFKLYNSPAGNTLGVDFSDKYSHDDLRTSEMHLVVNKPVKLVIHSQDVIHDVGLPQFRLKMDAVPGIPTTLWFTPQYTTEEMRKRTNNPNFTYEISCDQMCGKSHYSMRGVIVVETQEEYNKWLASQKPEYFTVYPDKDPANQNAPLADTSKNNLKKADVAVN